MPATIEQGTKEYVIVDVTDALGNLTTLTGTNPRYTVYDPSNSILINAVSAVIQGLSAYCMIDTSTGGPWPPGVYDLYLKFDVLPEVPVIGPFKFTIEVVPA